MLFEAATLPLLSVASVQIPCSLCRCWLARVGSVPELFHSQTLPTLQRVDHPTGHFVELDFAGNPVPWRALLICCQLLPQRAAFPFRNLHLIFPRVFTCVPEPPELQEPHVKSVVFLFPPCQWDKMEETLGDKPTEGDTTSQTIRKTTSETNPKTNSRKRTRFPRVLEQMGETSCEAPPETRWAEDRTQRLRTHHPTSAAREDRKQDRKQSRFANRDKPVLLVKSGGNA